ncbi:MAG: hypothetical protein A2033_07655 [Bacteroidetes bacterium GWA2_31_9]|nr:MAG: hypothetical protein A2033_07655 [Bacteroidetes bacterium GWA2_31_9]
MENNPLGFALQAIKTEQFATFEKNHSAKKEVSLTTDIEFKINTENKQVGVYTTFSFDQSKKVFIKIQVSCHFEISLDTWNSLLSENKIIFPHTFITHLAVLTIGTARGVLHSKTEGTEFNKYILPTLDISKMFTKDVEFILEK